VARYSKLLGEGEQWARMRVVRIGWVKHKVTCEDEIGRKVERIKTIMQYDLECECGRRKRVLQHAFKGKRKVQDCGCGLAEFDHPTSELTVGLPERLFRRVRVYANEDRISISRVICRLAEDYGEPWDWRRWNGVDELPVECWKYGIRVREMRIVFCMSLPIRMKAYLREAARWYGQSHSRILTGLISRRLDGARQDHGMCSPHERPSQALSESR